MIKNDYSLEQQASNEVTGGIINKGARDLIVLRYMARQMRVVLHSIEQPVIEPLPWYYSLEVRHQRIQNMIMYDHQSLLQSTTLSFVGFVGGKQKTVDSCIDNEMQRVDTLIPEELVNAPGLLCYSSLEFRTGISYNLVLFTDPNAKLHLKNSAIHRCAAYQLAPHYYEWIRLHSGIMPDGFSRNTLLLQKTKYYACQAPEPRFTVRELMCEYH